MDRTTNHARTATLLGVLLAAAGTTPPAGANDWINSSGGIFQNAANWTPGVPGPAETAFFNLASAGYTVDFNGSVTNLSLNIGTDIVDFDQGVFQYNLTNAVKVAVGAGRNGSLTIQNGALNAGGGSMIVADGAGAVGALTLAGSTASLSVGNMWIGGYGSGTSTGTLTLQNGATAVNTAGASIRVGAYTSTAGSINVTGPGSSFDTTAAVIYIGGDGYGALNVTAGGSADCGNVYVGYLAVGGSGDLHVSGAASSLTAADMWIGNNASAVMTIDTGGLVEITDPDPLHVGQFGQVYVYSGGTLKTGGSLVPGGLTRIGISAGGTAMLTVSGLGSLWETYGPVEIGDDGPGQVYVNDLAGHGNPEPVMPLAVGPDGALIISAGGTFESGDMTIGTGPGGTAELQISGAGSRLDLMGETSIGEQGPGVLTIDTGGLAGTGNPDAYDVGPFGQVELYSGGILKTGGTIIGGGLTRIGTAAGGTAMLTVNGSGSLWETYGPLEIGVDGPGQVYVTDLAGITNPTPNMPTAVGEDGNLIISAGGTFESGDMTIGTGPGGTAMVTVSETGSRLDLTGSASTGVLGDALVTLEFGALVEQTNLDPMDVGPFGQIELYSGGILRTGGTVVGGGLTRIGTSVGGTATLTVSGSGSLWETYGPVEIGVDGPGQVNVTDLAGADNPEPLMPLAVGPDGVLIISAGGTFESGDMTIGTGPGGTAMVTVTGAGSRADLLGGTSIGEQGPGLLTIDTGGLVEADEPPMIVGGQGTVTISAGGALRAVGPVCIGTAAGGLATLGISDAGTLWESFAPVEVGIPNPDPADVGAYGEVLVDGAPDIVIYDTLTVGAGGTYGPAGVYRGDDRLKKGTGTSPEALLGGVIGLELGARSLRESLLKKGTGTSPEALLNSVTGIELGASPLFQQAASGSLTADRVEIIGSCSESTEGGTVTLTDKMSLVSNGDIVLKAPPEESCPAPRGGCLPPPPRLSVGGSARAGGATAEASSMIIATGTTCASVTVSGSFARGAGPMQVSLGGDFLNYSKIPDQFDWTTGGLGLIGPGPHKVEVTGHNLGADLSGYNNNFAMGAVKIDPGAVVNFVDEFDNDDQGQTLQEALYVGDLTFGAGSTVTIDKCSVFYKTLTPNGVTPTLVEPGELLKVGSLAAPGLPADATHQVLKNRYISIDPGTNPGVDSVIKVEVAEMRRCQNAPTRGCMTDSDCDDVCDDIIAGDPPYHTLKCPPADCSMTVPPSTCIASGPCVDLAPTFRSLRSWVVQQPIQDPTGGCKKPGCPPYDPGEDNCCEDDDWIAYLGDTVPALTGGYTSWAQVWADLPAGVLHIAGCPIVPATTYAVYACDPDNLDLCSPPLLLSTAKFPVNARPVAFPLYADVCGGTYFPAPGVIEVLPPDGYVSVKDLGIQNLTIINYGSVPHPDKPRMHMTWADVHGTGTGIPPNYNLSVADLMAVYVFSLTDNKPYVNTQGGLDPQDCP